MADSYFAFTAPLDWAFVDDGDDGYGCAAMIVEDPLAVYVITTEYPGCVVHKLAAQSHDPTSPSTFHPTKAFAPFRVNLYKKPVTILAHVAKHLVCAPLCCAIGKRLTRDFTLLS